MKLTAAVFLVVCIGAGSSCASTATDPATSAEAVIDSSTTTSAPNNGADDSPVDSSSGTDGTVAVKRWIGQVQSEAQENNLGWWGVDVLLSSGPPNAPEVYRVGFPISEVTCLSGEEPRLAAIGPEATISFVTNGDVEDSDPPGIPATSVEFDC